MSTTTFETTIKNYLDNRAREDSLFAETYKKANKSIKGCCRYIISRARKLKGSGTAVAVDDATVFGWAVHYYDEDSPEVEAAPAEAVKVAAPAAVVKPGPAKPAAPKRQKAKKTNHRADDSLQLSLFGEL